jgi:regulator of protease activity HflC (stomatin/prohibitin superfamily)
MKGETRTKIKLFAAISLLALLILGAVYAVLSWTSFGQGTAMIKVSQIDGSISKPIVGPASGFIFNGIYRLFRQEYPVFIQYQRTSENTLGMWGDGSDTTADYPAVSCFSKDQLEMNIDIMMRWELDINELVQLYKNYPTQNWKSVIASIAREQMRIVTSTKYTAVETIENRDVVRKDIMDAIISKLNVEPSLVGAILNVEFELRNIGYPTEYTASITTKLAAQQQLKQAEFDAQKVIVLARANAEQVLIQANASAQAKVMQAQGLKESIAIIVSQTGLNESEIVKLYMWLDTLKTVDRPTFFLFLGQDGIPILVPIQPNTQTAP